jgi:hypothetical protein
MDAFKSRWTHLYQAVEALPGIDWSHTQQLEMLTTLQQKLIKKKFGATFHLFPPISCQSIIY